MSRTKQLKTLERLIRPYGLVIIRGSHHKIVRADNGKTIYTMEGSPKAVWFVENTIHDLVKMGAVGKELDSIRIR